MRRSAPQVPRWRFVATYASDVALFFLLRPDDAAIDRSLAAARSATPTFERIGATRSPTSIPGFRFATYSGAVGEGSADYHAAKDGLRAWAAHVGAGVSVTPANEPLVEGATIVASTQVGPLHVLIPCRVVYIVDEEHRFGFAYATLPGHPECGEESFIAEHAPDGTVTFTVSAHSRHAALLAKLGAPVSRFVQRRTNTSYIAGLAAFVDRQRR